MFTESEKLARRECQDFYPLIQKQIILFYMSIHSTLNHHLRERQFNHGWVSQCLSGLPGKFPYHLSSRITVPSLPNFPNNNLVSLPYVQSSTKPLYVVNIPLGHLPGDQNDTRFQTVLNVLKKDAFGMTEDQSKQEIFKRVAVVIGINQIQSIDPSLNRGFQRYILNLPKIEGIAYGVFGFTWNPVWECSKNSNYLYAKPKAFLLLKALSKKCADQVRIYFEGNGKLSSHLSQLIPYQRIRERIKTHTYTTYTTNLLAEQSPGSRIYYTVMDADCKNLRTTNGGVFSRFDRHLNNKNVTAITLGYKMTDKEEKLIQLGVWMDMKVRQAMNSAIPFSAYFPEPCSAFLIRIPGQTHKLNRITFLGGRGSRLENRRLIESGIKSKVLDQNALFIADGGVTIETPERTIHKSNTGVIRITPKIIKQKRMLRALRGIFQSHIHPKKWADQVYSALDFTSSQVTDTTTPLMHIFSIYDPISRMFTKGALEGRYSTTVFDDILKKYPVQGKNGKKSVSLTKVQQEILDGQVEELRDNQKMPREMIKKIQLAAKRSGIMIYRILKKFSEN